MEKTLELIEQTGFALLPQIDGLAASEHSTTPLARALRQARELRQLSPATVCASTGLTLNQLSGIEVGGIHPSSELVTLLADLYGLSLERLGTSKWVPRSAPRLDTEARVLWIEWLPISFGEDAGSNAETLHTVAKHLRFIRGLESYAPVRMRSDEFDLLVSILDRTDTNLFRDVVMAMRLPWREAAELLESAQERVWTKDILARARSLAELSAERGRRAIV